jgi:hypothetical protein
MGRFYAGIVATALLAGTAAAQLHHDNIITYLRMMGMVPPSS